MSGVFLVCFWIVSEGCHDQAPRYSHLSHRHGRTALPAVHNEAPRRERPIGRTRQRTRAGETGRGC